MNEVSNIDDCLVEHAPYGSFPVWSFKDMQKAELPAACEDLHQAAFPEL